VRKGGFLGGELGCHKRRGQTDANSVNSELDFFGVVSLPLTSPKKKCPTNAASSTFKASTLLLGLRISPTSSKGLFPASFAHLFEFCLTHHTSDMASLFVVTFPLVVMDNVPRKYRAHSLRIAPHQISPSHSRRAPATFFFSNSFRPSVVTFRFHPPCFAPTVERSTIRPALLLSSITATHLSNSRTIGTLPTLIMTCSLRHRLRLKSRALNSTNDISTRHRHGRSFEGHRLSVQVRRPRDDSKRSATT
jgi:hypothetical protein